MDARLQAIRENVTTIIKSGAAQGLPAEQIDGFVSRYLSAKGYDRDSFRAAVIDSQPDAETGAQRYGRQVSVGALEGSLAIPGMVYDLARAPVEGARLLANEIGADIPRVPTSSDLIARAQPKGSEPKSDGERYVRRITREVAAVPSSMLAGAANRLLAPLMQAPVSQVAGAAGSAAAGQAAEDAGAGAAGQLAASIGGGPLASTAVPAAAAVGRAAAAAIEPFSPAGRQRMAGNVLLRAASDPQNLDARITAGLNDPNARLPTSEPTTAQAARDPGLMMFERGLDAMDPRLRNAAALRNQSRAAAIAGMGDGSTPGQRGAAVREVLGDQRDQARGTVGAQYQRVDPNGTMAVPLRDVGQGMFDAALRRFGEGSGGVPPQAAELLDEVRTAATQGRAVNFEWLQNMRSRLGELAGKASQSGDGRLAATYGDMQASLDGAVERAMSAGGVTPRQRAAWERATSARRAMGERFERDETGANATGRILDADRFGRPKMQDESVASRAIADLPSIEQTLRAAGPRAPEVQAQLRGQFVQDMYERARTTGATFDAAGNMTEGLSPAQFLRFFEDRRPVARRLFNGPGHFRALERLVNDFDETAATNATAKARGSDTAQNLSVGNLIARATNGLVEPNSPLAQTLFGVGPFLRWAYQAPEIALREMLVDAAVDPRFAQSLIRQASPQNMRRAANYLNAPRFARRLEDAVTAAGARQAARTAVATGSTGPKEGPSQ